MIDRFFTATDWHGTTCRGFVRAWGYRLGMLRYLLFWLRHSDVKLGEISLRRFHHCNSHCYCPTGTGIQWRFELLGFGAWGTVESDPTVRPCICDQVVEQMTEFPQPQGATA